MAISNNGQQFNTNNARNYIDLTGFAGSGEVGRYKDEVTGVLVGIEPRDGFYQVQDRKTGQMIQRPNSWTAHFEDGSMWSWPTYVDEQTNTVRPWSRFDPSINLAACVQQRIVIHVWKDDRNFSHLEIAEQQVAMNPNPIPVMAAPTVPVTPTVAPWQQK
jgi:hypothetical protein